MPDTKIDPAVFAAPDKRGLWVEMFGRPATTHVTHWTAERVRVHVVPADLTIRSAGEAQTGGILEAACEEGGRVEYLCREVGGGTDFIPGPYPTGFKIYGLNRYGCHVLGRTPYSVAALMGRSELGRLLDALSLQMRWKPLTDPDPRNAPEVNALLVAWEATRVAVGSLMGLTTPGCVLTGRVDYWDGKAQEAAPGGEPGAVAKGEET